MNLLHNFGGVFGRALLRSHLNQLVVFLLRFDEHLPFRWVMTARLLDVDVLPGAQTGNGHGCVPVIRGSDRDRIDVSEGKDFAVIFFCCDRFACFLLRRFREFGEDVAVNVANMRKSSAVLVRLDRRKMSVTAAIEADHGEVEPVIRSEDPSVAPRCHCGSHSGRGESQRVQELTSCRHFRYLRSANLKLW